MPLSILKLTIPIAVSNSPCRFFLSPWRPSENSTLVLQQIQIITCLFAARKVQDCGQSYAHTRRESGVCHARIQPVWSLLMLSEASMTCAVQSVWRIHVASPCCDTIRKSILRRMGSAIPVGLCMYQFRVWDIGVLHLPSISMSSPTRSEGPAQCPPSGLVVG